MRTVQLSIYSFDELSPSAQVNAIGGWMARRDNFNFSTEQVIENIRYYNHEFLKDGIFWSTDLEMLEGSPQTE